MSADDPTTNYLMRLMDPALAYSDFDDAMPDSLPMNRDMVDGTYVSTTPQQQQQQQQQLSQLHQQHQQQQQQQHQHGSSAGLSGDHVFSPDDMSASLHDSGPDPGGNLGSGPGGGSTVTEYTKRRNWAPRTVEEIRDFLHILDADGKVKHVSQSVEALTGYKPAEIINKFLRDLIHPDDVGVFSADFNEAIASGTPLRLFYRLRKKDGTWRVFETMGHAHIAAANFAPNPNNQSPFCQAVFMMARPYPTSNASLLDTFLEHKMENERLMRRINELKREEFEDVEESQRTWRQSQEGRSEIASSEGTARAGGATTPFYVGAHAAGGGGPTSPDRMTMPPPERPTTAAALNAALTRENLEGIAGSSRPDSIRDKMARFEGQTTTHAETIEMMTGLRYQEGERSRGITTGNASPTLIKGDAGIAIPVERDPRTGEKKKRQKMPDEYVCTDCGKFLCSTGGVAALAHCWGQARWTRPSGARGRRGQRRCAMRAVSGGPRRRRRGIRILVGAVVCKMA
jgi:PAS domain S-box-containing protein